MKSDGYKRGVAFTASFVVTLSIFFVWATVKFPNAIPGGAVLADRAGSGGFVATEEVHSASFASALFATKGSDGKMNSDSNTDSSAKSDFSRVSEKQGPFASFKQNAALSFAAVKEQLNFLGKYIGETKYEAEDGEVEVVPSGTPAANSSANSGANSSVNSASNRGSSVIY